MSFSNWFQGIKHSMFSKEVELDKTISAKLKKVRAGNVLHNEIKKGCDGIEEYDRKIHLFKAEGIIDSNVFDTFKTDKSVEAYQKVIKATENLSKEDRKKALLMLERK